MLLLDAVQRNVVMKIVSHTNVANPNSGIHTYTCKFSQYSDLQAATNSGANEGVAAWELCFRGTFVPFPICIFMHTRILKCSEWKIERVDENRKRSHNTNLIKYVIHYFITTVEFTQ